MTVENGVPEDKDWCMRAVRKGYHIRVARKSLAIAHQAVMRSTVE